MVNSQVRKGDSKNFESFVGGLAKTTVRIRLRLPSELVTFLYRTPTVRFSTIFDIPSANDLRQVKHQHFTVQLSLSKWLPRRRSTVPPTRTSPSALRSVKVSCEKEHYAAGHSLTGIVHRRTRLRRCTYLCFLQRYLRPCHRSQVNTTPSQHTQSTLARRSVDYGRAKEEVHLQC